MRAGSLWPQVPPSIGGCDSSFGTTGTNSTGTRAQFLLSAGGSHHEGKVGKSLMGMKSPGKSDCIPNDCDRLTRCCLFAKLHTVYRPMTAPVPKKAFQSHLDSEGCASNTVQAKFGSLLNALISSSSPRGRRRMSRAVKAAITSRWWRHSLGRLLEY